MSPSVFPARAVLPLALAFAILGPVYAANGFLQPVHTDAGVFLQAGQTIVDGGAPYLDFWDHKGPLLYLLNAAGVWLTPGHPLGTLILEAVLVWLAMAALGVTMGGVMGLRHAEPILLFGLAAYVHFHHFGNYTQNWALPGQVLALLAFVHGRGGERAGSRHGLAVGAGLAWGLLLQPTTAAGAALVAAWLVARRIGLLPWIALGVLGVAGPVLAWLAAKGALADALDQYIGYNLAYVDNASREHRLHAGLYFVTRLVAVGLLALAPSGLLALAGAARSPESSPLFPGWSASAVRWTVSALGAVLAVEMAMLPLSGRTYSHYAVDIIPVATMIAGVGLERVAPARRTAWLATLIPALVLGHFAWASLIEGPADKVRQDRAAAFVRAATRPGDTMLVFGVDTSLNFLSDRRPPSRYGFQLPLVFPGYATPARREEFLVALRRSPPRLVVDAGNENFAPLRAPSLPEDRADHALDGLRAWVAASYVLQADMPWTRGRIARIYRR